MAADTQKPCKTDYVYLEMVLNKETKYDVVSGLFKGIIEKKGQTFILLHGLKNSTDVLNLKFYNFMSIEELTGDFKNYTYLNSEQTDQDTALEMVTAIYKELMAAGFGLVNDGKLIDIEKYRKVPVDYKDGKPLVTGTGTAGSASGVGSFANPGTRYVNNNGIYSRNTVIKKDPEPSLFKRTKTKKPTKVAIDLMVEKLAQIRAGNFEPSIPDTLGVDAAGEHDADDDDTSAYGYGYGMC